MLPREDAEPKRVLFEFGKHPGDVAVSSIAILKKGSNDAAEEYTELTKDFYLNF